jgi:TonB family protein
MQAMHRELVAARILRTAALLSLAVGLFQIHLSASPQHVQVAGSVTEGLLLTKTPPVYPPIARQARIQGTVVLAALISKEGSVEKLTLMSGHPMLAQAAIDAVKQWKYKPYLLNGEPVEVDTEIRVIFTLSPPEPPTPANATPDAQTDGVAGPGPKPEESVGPGGKPLYHRGEGTSDPKIISQVDPEYSEAARQAGFQGICVLSLIVEPDGAPSNIQVSRKLGMGLDEKALEAVKKWRFRPSMKDGQPVRYGPVEVVVDFHLSKK